MNPKDFEREWSAMIGKLSGPERDMLDTVLAGAEVNHSMAWMLIAFALGAAFGACLMGLFG